MCARQPHAEQWIGRIRNTKVKAMTSGLEEVDWAKIPAPVDDGLANHLEGAMVPSVPLPSTAGTEVDLATLAGTTVVYIYPRTGEPDKPLPENWDVIPGARGCTPQACAFRDHFAELRDVGADHLFGLSVQDTDYQKRAAERLHLPFPLLSDHRLLLAHALKLPTMEAAGMTLLKRLTMIIDQGRISQVFYPVFPPDRNAADVVDWLRKRHEGQA